MKTFCLTLLGGAALGSALALAGGRTAAAVPPAPRAERSCKPQAPVALTLVQVDQSAGLTRLEITLRPVIDLLALDWSLELPTGAALIEGELSGMAGGARGSETRASLVVSLPVDSRHQRVQLVASGTLLGSDETGVTFAEPIVASTSLHWGVPEPDAPTALTVDPLSGERELAVILPARRVERR